MLLGLHGFRENGAILRGKLERLGLEAVCPDAPLLVDPTQNLREWWPVKLNPGETLRHHLHTPHSYEGYESTKAYLKKTLPLSEVQAVIAFCQGATLATILLLRGCLPNVRRAVLFAAPDVMDPSLLPGEARVPISALLIQGEQDPFLSSEDALKVSRHYTQAEIYLHRQGHVIPTSGPIRVMVQRFLGEK